MARFSEKLAKRRNKLGLTVDQAADKAEISPSTWRRLEADKGRFSLDEIRRAAKAMDLVISVTEKSHPF